MKFFFILSIGVIMAQEKAIFAGGCFWCMESPFESNPGIISAVSGYSGGEEENPTYKQVAYGQTSHTEAVEITYDPSKISYQELLDIYWQTFDPTDTLGQFGDRGSQYRPVIFYSNEEQKEIAEKSKNTLQASKRFSKDIIVPILAAKKFWPAEEYHQNYYKKDPVHYWKYRKGSGRHEFLKKHWGKDIAEKKN